MWLKTASGKVSVESPSVQIACCARSCFRQATSAWRQFTRTCPDDTWEARRAASASISVRSGEAT
jgi:hypothetical protein